MSNKCSEKYIERRGSLKKKQLQTPLIVYNTKDIINHVLSICHPEQRGFPWSFEHGKFFIYLCKLTQILRINIKLI